MDVCNPNIPMANPRGHYFVRKKTPPQHLLLVSLFMSIIYDTNLKNLSNGKSPSQDCIPNDILKALPQSFHNKISFPAMLPPKSNPQHIKIHHNIARQKRQPYYHNQLQTHSPSMYYIQAIYKHTNHSPEHIM